MSETAIRVNRLWKQYKIGGSHKTYGTLRDQMVSGLKSMFSRTENREAGASDVKLALGRGEVEVPGTFWALKDVSFEVKQGEVLGIIGRNGAGKSTLLKLLSRITEPTSGRIEINGRVSSLLEVGTGFHGELTGRENTYLNGAILGMKRAEINRKFDEIVAFAGVEDFIDTPVKHYSSGMYLRLAFAVAAHLEPEILIVDEVLAVGDADFQRKCLGKMAGVADQGRTIFFVSHNMPAITRLCKRVLYMDEGHLRLDGSAHEVVKSYLHSELGTMSSREWPEFGKAPKGEIARLWAVRVRTDDGICTDKIDIRRPVGIEIEYEVLKPGFKLRSSIGVNNDEGVHVFEAIENNPDWRLRIRNPGRYRVTAWIPGNFLAEGTMIVDVGLGTVQPNILQCIVRQAVAFHVVDSCDGDSARGDYAGPLPGVVRPLLKWDTELDSNYADDRQ
jgi:lipopolysaccharide transport system ATP-binding protein